MRGPNSMAHHCSHGVVLVGFDSINNQKVWTVKDSIGGELGGIKHVARDVYSEGGTRGIARYCLYARKKWPNKVGPVRSETGMNIKKVSSLFQYSKLTFIECLNNLFPQRASSLQKNTFAITFCLLFKFHLCFFIGQKRVTSFEFYEYCRPEY